MMFPPQLVPADAETIFAGKFADNLCAISSRTLLSIKYKNIYKKKKKKKKKKTIISAILNRQFT